MLKLPINFLIALTLVLFFALMGCGSGSQTDESVQIRTAADNYTIEDLKAFGFKTSKHYDVEGLPDGLDAWKGFWGLDPYDRHDYEIRFYASHDLAVSSGKAIAIESSGAEFEANRDTTQPLFSSGENSGYRIFKKKTDLERGCEGQMACQSFGLCWSNLSRLDDTWEYGDSMRWT